MTSHNNEGVPRVQTHLIDAIITNWGSSLSTTEESALRRQLITLDLPAQDVAKLEAIATQKQEAA